MDKVFTDPKKHLPAHLTGGIGKTLCDKWKRLPSERRNLLKLISRFEISRDQATCLYVKEERTKAGIEVEDKDILANPYLLYEITRLNADPISIWTVDRGVFPDEVIRNKHPLPEPTVLDAGTDARRVRGLTIKVLEDAAANGNTLLPQDQAAEPEIRAKIAAYKRLTAFTGFRGFLAIFIVVFAYLLLTAL